MLFLPTMPLLDSLAIDCSVNSAKVVWENPPLTLAQVPGAKIVSQTRERDYRYIGIS